MSNRTRERIEWYVSRLKIADELLGKTFPDMGLPERRDRATMIACTEGLVDELENVTSAIAQIECGGS